MSLVASKAATGDVLWLLACRFRMTTGRFSTLGMLRGRLHVPGSRIRLVLRLAYAIQRGQGWCGLWRSGRTGVAY